MRGNRITLDEKIEKLKEIVSRNKETAMMHLLRNCINSLRREMRSAIKN